jgi:hypothetical protein
MGQRPEVQLTSDRRQGRDKGDGDDQESTLADGRNHFERLTIFGRSRSILSQASSARWFLFKSKIPTLVNFGGP